MTSAPILDYFPLAGRGELSRLICATAGVDIVNNIPGLRYKTKCGWFGTLPVVRHGTVTFAQSGAVQKYFSALSQKWKLLTPQQVAVDDMFAAYLEDLIGALFKAKDAKSIPTVMDKYMAALEQLVPPDGFIHGQGFPTTADLVLFVVTHAFMPVRFFLKKAKGYTWQDRFPKIKGNVDRTFAVPEIQTYVRGSKTLKAGPATTFAKLIGSTLSCGCNSLSPISEEPPSGPARAPSSIDTEVIELVYFPIAGRGELCRLLAAVGGVSLEVLPPPEDQSHKKKFTGSLPQMKHGDFELTQSSAIESHIAAIAPKFQGLTSQQRAIDDCYAATKEDIIQGMSSTVFGPEEGKKAASAKLPALLDRFLSVLEKKAPEQGFTHGLDFPTGADLTLLIITSAGLPFQVAYQAAGYDWQSKFPKIKALVERTQAAPGVREYLSSSKSFGATSF